MSPQGGEGARCFILMPGQRCLDEGRASSSHVGLGPRLTEMRAGSREAVGR